MRAVRRLEVSKVKGLVLRNPESEKKKYDFTIHYFWNDVKQNDIWDIDEKLIFKLLIFESQDGNKVSECYNACEPADDEVMLFLETDSDTFSNQVLYGKVPKKLQQFFSTQIKNYNKNFFDSGILGFVQQKFGGATKEIIEELLLKGYIEKRVIEEFVFAGIRFIFANVSIVGKALGWIVEKVGEAIDLLKIPDKFWDDQDENYLFTKESILSSLTIDTSGFVSQVLQADMTSIKTIVDIYGKSNFEKKIDFFASPVAKVADAYNAFVTQIVGDVFEGLENNSEITEEIKQVFALLAGLWNGLVDFVSSTLKFIGDLTQAGFDIANNWQEFLETVDNIIDSLANINVAELWEGITILYEQVKTYFKEADGLNWVRIAYIVGYGIAFIGTMFIPIVGWVGKIAKVDKLIPEELLAVLRKSGETLATTLSTKSKNAQLKALQQCDELLRIFAKGRQAIKEFFTKLADDIGAWLVKNKKIFSLYEEDIFRSKLMKILSKTFDKAPKGIIEYEKKIYEFSKEWAAIYTKEGKIIKDITTNLNDSVVVGKNLSKLEGAIVTHNHPLGSSLSGGDIITFLKTGMKEVRAVAKTDQSVFSLKNLGKRFTKVEIGIIEEIVENLTKPLKGKVDPVYIDRMKADAYIRELQKLEGRIEYIHYKP